MGTRRFLLPLFGVLLFTTFTVHATGGDKAAQIDAYLQSYCDLHQFNGSALVAENGRVILKKGYGMADFEWSIPNAADTKHRIGSITKPFTAILILQLIDEGKLSLETKITEVLPYYRKDTGERVTIRHLLNHTSGIPSFTGLAKFRADLRRDPVDPKEMVETYCMGDLEFEPGSEFRYNNSGFYLLGAIIEEVTGKPYEEVLQARIFYPAKMKDTLYGHTDAIIPKRAAGYVRIGGGVQNAPYTNMSIPFSAGALLSTVEDLFRLDQAFYEDTILSPSSKKAMFTAGKGGYGFGIGVAEQPVGPGGDSRISIGHSGGIEGFNTTFRRIQEDRHCVILFSNTGGAPLGAMTRGIFDILYGRVPSPPKKSISEALWRDLGDGSVEDAVARYRDLKENHPEEYDFGENQLNTIGYQLLTGGRVADAVDIFKLNVELFPDSFNPHDSLGEAYMQADDKESAIRCYAQSLVLNPGNTNAITMLQKLNEGQ
jgi:CubicO group peptidase (beta-lactamase class C family)